MNKPIGAVLAATFAAIAVAGPAVGDESEVEGATLLDPITVTEPVPPLDKELWRLKMLLDATTPCLGCDAEALPTRENILQGLVRFVFVPTEPPPRDEARQILSTVRCAQAGPESEFRCR